MQRPDNFEIRVRSKEEHAAMWVDLVKAGYDTTPHSEETLYRGVGSLIKCSGRLGYIWTSQCSGDHPPYSAHDFKVVFSHLFAVPTEKPTMDDLIRMVSLDQELGCMQAELDNLQDMIYDKILALKEMQEKFNIAP